MQNRHSQGEFASEWSGRCVGVRRRGLPNPDSFWRKCSAGLLLVVCHFFSPYSSSIWGFSWSSSFLACSFVILLGGYSRIRYLWLWSCTRRVICPGDNFLCTSSLQFPDRSWEFCKYDHKNVPRPSSMHSLTFLQIFILLITPWQWAFMTGLVKDYRPFSSRLSPIISLLVG